MSRTKTIFATALLASAAFAQAPSNNSCSNAINVFDGTNPQPPNGTSGQLFTNVLATNSSVSLHNAECAPVTFYKDVWFAYTATRTGAYTINTCTPSGFTSGSLTETIVAVYAATTCPSGGSALVCNDDSSACGFFSNRSAVSVNLTYNVAYLIRVGTENSVSTGTFYLTINEPAFAANNTCAGATSVVAGMNAGLSTNGSTPLSSQFGCGGWESDRSDVWHTYSPPLLFPLGAREITITLGGDPSHEIAVYKGTCTSFPTSFASSETVACGGQQVSFSYQVLTTFYIRVGVAHSVQPAGFDYSLNIEVKLSPPNNLCANGLNMYGGTFPYHPNQASFFTNVGATTTSLSGMCTSYNSDVWYSLLATSTGMWTVSTQTPAGQTPGTLLDTVLAVFPGCGFGPPIACNDDFGGTLLSSLDFYAVQGQTYKIMVADFGNTWHNEGDFWLQVYGKFNQVLTSPGPGLFQLNNNFGGQNHYMFNCLTVHQGAFPFGPFFGIEPTATELSLQLSGGPPFTALLDGAGAYQFGPFNGGPSVSGLTIYGVGLEFDLLGAIAGVTNFSVVTIQ